MFILQTDRLILRRWKPQDLDSFAALNADPRVMEFFPSTLSRTESETFISSMEERIEKTGFGFWAAELKTAKELIGFIGLNVPNYPLPFSPCVEIGWRLAHAHWGQGLALEGARASLEHGFETSGLEEVVAFTALGNHRSRRVMEKLGMNRDIDGDFLHPKLAATHPLAKHVLYRISRRIA